MKIFLFSRYVTIAVIILLVGFLVGYIFIDLPQSFIHELAKPIAEYEAKHQYGKIFFWIFSHNTFASFLALAAGPFALLQLFFNGIILGSVAQVAIHNTHLTCFIVGIAPHGVFELPAFIGSVALGTRLFHLIWQHFWRQKNKWETMANPVGFINTLWRLPLGSRYLIQTVKLYCFVILPLLFFAAAIETYVTRIAVEQICPR